MDKAEALAILGAGLALMPVQHVALPGWQPNTNLGTLYGNFAATYAAGGLSGAGLLAAVMLALGNNACFSKDSTLTESLLAKAGPIVALLLLVWAKGSNALVVYFSGI